MPKLYNLARMTTTTAGTGTITLGVAVSGYLTFANAGVQNGDVVFYGIKDGSGSEVGWGTYTSSGTTLTRNVVKSTSSNAAISLSGSAEVYITALAGDGGDLLPGFDHPLRGFDTRITCSSMRPSRRASDGRGQRQQRQRPGSSNQSHSVPRLDHRERRPTNGAR